MIKKFWIRYSPWLLSVFSVYTANRDVAHVARHLAIACWAVALAFLTFGLAKIFNAAVWGMGQPAYKPAIQHVIASLGCGAVLLGMMPHIYNVKFEPVGVHLILASLFTFGVWQLAFNVYAVLERGALTPKKAISK